MVYNAKKILFVIPSYSIGGVTSSLYAFLSQMDKKRCDVDVFCRNHQGPMKRAFEGISHVVPENVWLSVYILEGGKIKNLCCQILRGVRGAFKKIGVNLYPLYCRIGGRQIHSEKYDTIISFHEDLSPIVCYYPAKRRVAWIHCDYKRQHAAVGKTELKEYSRFDKIVCVSEYVKNVFIDFYPTLTDRVDALHNVVDVKRIQRRAKEEIGEDYLFDTSCFTIVSVGRLDPVKQFDKIPAIAAEVRRIVGDTFKWFIIGGSRGYANNEQRMKDDINRLHLQENVILLGEKQNIYPYLAKANLFVCTSKSESFPMVVLEARALGLPIISTDFPSAHEALQGWKSSKVVSLNEMGKAIAKAMTEPMKIADDDRNNTIDIIKFHSLILE